MIPLLINSVWDLKLVGQEQKAPYGVEYEDHGVVFSSAVVDLDDVKFLIDATSCIITEERNGDYELKMTYSTEGSYFSDIEVDKFIVAKPNTSDGAQPFRIYKVTTSLDGKVTVYADHASRVLKGIASVGHWWGGGGTYNNAGRALRWLFYEAIYGGNTRVGSLVPYPLDVDIPYYTLYERFTSDVVSSESWWQTFDAPEPSSLFEYLMGRQGSLLQFFGGEYKFNWFDVSLLQNRGQDNGVFFIYGKNVKGITQTIDTSKTYSGVFPFWRGYENAGDEYDVVLFPELEVHITQQTSYWKPKVIFADNHSSFPYEKILCLNLTDKFQEVPTGAQLEAEATSYMNNNKIYEPDVSLDISLATGYSGDNDDLSQFENVSLCDIVTVSVPKFGINVKAKVTKTEYDCLRERYDRILVGTVRKSFSRTIGDTIDSIESTLSSKTSTNAAEINTLKAYANQESLNLYGATFAGYLTNGKTRIQFSILLPKKFTAVTKAEISGNFVIRHADGGYIGTVNGQTLQSLGTVTVKMSGICVWVNVDLSTASTVTNNVPIVVQGSSGSALTFTKEE